MPDSPTRLATFLARWPLIGICGGREMNGGARQLVNVLIDAIAPSTRVCVSDAPGVAALIRWHIEDERRETFALGAYGPISSPWTEARRSAALVEHVFRAGGLLVAIPTNPTPTGVSPQSDARACFVSLSDGAWSSLAYALGLALQTGEGQVLVGCPPPLQPPVDWALRQGTLAGWWLGPPKP